MRWVALTLLDSILITILIDARSSQLLWTHARLRLRLLESTIKIISINLLLNPLDLVLDINLTVRESL